MPIFNDLDDIINLEDYSFEIYIPEPKNVFLNSSIAYGYYNPNSKDLILEITSTHSFNLLSE